MLISDQFVFVISQQKRLKCLYPTLSFSHVFHLFLSSSNDGSPLFTYFLSASTWTFIYHTLLLNPMTSSRAATSQNHTVLRCLYILSKSMYWWHLNQNNAFLSTACLTFYEFWHQRQIAPGNDKDSYELCTSQ